MLLGGISERNKELVGFCGRRHILRKAPQFHVDLHLLPEKEMKFYKTWILRTDKEREEIASYEQPSEKWKLSRRYRITGSKFPGAVGHNHYESPKKVAHEMIHGEFKGNKHTRRGNELEPKACAVIEEREKMKVEMDLKEAQLEGRTFIRYANREFSIPSDYTGKVYEIRHQGLVVCKEMPWIAASSDGDIYLFGKMIGQIEIKCPGRNQFYPLTPAYYFDQIQGNMYLSQAAFCLVVVYTENPGAINVEQIEYDREYCEQFLIPSLNAFWFKTLLPMAIAFEEDRLIKLSTLTTSSSSSSAPSSQSFPIWTHFGGLKHDKDDIPVSTKRKREATTTTKRTTKKKNKTALTG